MPVSVVCESTANVNAALRESLSGSCSAAAAAEDCKLGVSAMSASSSGNSGGGNNINRDNDDDDDDCLQSKLVASAKRVLLSKIDYEEVSNYSQSVLDSLKSKYIVLKPSSNANVGNGINNGENGRASSANCASNNTGNNNGVNGMNRSIVEANGNGNNNNNNTPTKRQNPNELPQPKRVLFPRENVRIGWKNPTRRWEVGVGMMNVGNTCYLNSTLQALFHVPSIANWLVSDVEHMKQCDGGDIGCIICAMAKTLMSSQNNQSAIRPHFIYSKLKLICKHLVMGRQEDAHEFLRYLIDAMEKSYLSRFRNFKELDQYSKETTPLNQILGGYLKSAVRCLACNHVSVTFQHFEDLLLDIRKADTIDEALDGYFARERLEDMGYKCESCKKKVSATKQFSLERAPIALCIQLKRFSMVGGKLNKHITIKPRLDLSKFASRKSNNGEQLTYRLVAMVTHLGASQHCGHYTAIGLTESGTYYNYDDSYVRPISLPNVCNTNAYIIFYEMDNAPPRHVTSTQISNNGGNDMKENYQKVNGYAIGANSNASPQRIIGPQLPPGGLSSYTSTLNVNRTPITNGGGTPFSNSNGSKLGINRQSAIPTSSNSKIMIHFKNNNSNGNGNLISKSNATTTTTSYQNGSSNNSNNHTQQLQNGLLYTGTGKFQEPTYTKCALAGAANKEQTATTANDNESSSDHENEIVSSSTTTTNINNNSNGNVTKALLPSMPKLFDSNMQYTSANNQPQNGIGSKKALATSSSSSSLKDTALKSLVPYGLESDDDDASASSETKRAKCSTTSTTTPTVHFVKNPLKRCSSISSESSTGSDNITDDNDDDNDGKPTNGYKVKKATITTTSSSTPNTHNLNSTFNAINGNASSTAPPSTAQSKAKQKTDVIGEIFNSLQNNKRNTNGNVTTPTKKQKSQQQQQFLVSSTTPTTTNNDNYLDNHDDDNNDDVDEHTNSNTKKRKSTQRTPFRRSNSTPPSPPVIKTKTGFWQVTALPPTDASEEQKCTPPKNPKNPFATKAPSHEASVVRRPKAEKQRQQFAGNGYQCDATSDGAVNELLKQTHRGYGAAVLSWNGDQTEIEKELRDEAREQRQRDWQEEEDNEMDRGRQKKVKSNKDTHASNNRNLTPGYNRFQELESAQRRWKHGGSGGHRYHAGHFAHKFQRNKFKFQRFNHKFQRVHHRNGSGTGNGNSNGFRRRDS